MIEDGPAKQWIDAGLRALRRDGVEAVRVERLAESIGKTKGSFYWHFKDRQALLDAMALAWRARATMAVIAEVEAAGGDARARLSRLFALTLAADGRLERAMRDWSRGDAQVARAMASVDRRRLRYLAGLMTQAGVSADLARLRARVAYQSLIGRFVMRARARNATGAELGALTDWMLSPQPNPAKPAAPRLASPQFPVKPRSAQP